MLSRASGVHYFNKRQSGKAKDTFCSVCNNQHNHKIQFRFTGVKSTHLRGSVSKQEHRNTKWSVKELPITWEGIFHKHL